MNDESLALKQVWKSVDDHEDRIRALEKTVWRAAGAVMASNIALALFLKFLHG